MSASSTDVFENQTRAVSWDILTPTMPFALIHVIQSPAGLSCLQELRCSDARNAKRALHSQQRMLNELQLQKLRVGCLASTICQ
jgi:hypothetical protein